MKKADVLQLSIVLLALAIGFNALQYVLNSLLDFFVWLFSGAYGAEYYMTANIKFLVAMVVQCLACWWVIKKSAPLAKYVYKISDLGTGFKITGNPGSLLQLLIITLGIYLLIAQLPSFLSEIVRGFISKTPRGDSGLFEDQRPVDWLKFIFDIALPVLLLIFSKTISDYFSKNIQEEAISIEESFGKSEKQ